MSKRKKILTKRIKLLIVLVPVMLILLSVTFFSLRYIYRLSVGEIDVEEIDIHANEITVFNPSSRELQPGDVEVEYAGDVIGVNENVIPEDGTDIIQIDESLTSGDSITVSAPGDDNVVSVDDYLDDSFFSIAIDDYDSNIYEGDSSQISLEVENTGDIEDEQSIEFEVDGETMDSETISLDAGESRSISFYFETEEGDEGSYNFEVFTSDDSVSSSIFVESGELLVDIEDIAEDVVRGNRLLANVSYENTGFVGYDEEILISFLDSDDEEVYNETDEISLDSFDSKIEEYNFVTDGMEFGEYVLSVTVDNRSDYRGFNIIPEGFDFHVEDTNVSVVEGEDVNVSAKFINEGVDSDTEIINFTIFDDDSNITYTDEAPLTLEAGENETLTYTWETEWGDYGDYEVVIESEMVSESFDFEVVQQDHTDFEVTITYGTDDVYVQAGEVFDLEVYVINLGNVEGMQKIELLVGDTVVDSKYLTLGPRNDSYIDLSWETDDDLTPGDYALQTISDDSSDDIEVTVYE